jgi:hypothetical protein
VATRDLASGIKRDCIIRGVSLFHFHPLNHGDIGMMAKILFEK